MTAAAVRACGRRKMTHVCKHVLMPRRPGETCGAPARAEPRTDTHTRARARARARALHPTLSHPAPTTLLWTYPGIRGQRARPVLCLIASALVFIWHLKKKKKNYSPMRPPHGPPGFSKTGDAPPNTGPKPQGGGLGVGPLNADGIGVGHRPARRSGAV